MWKDPESADAEWRKAVEIVTEDEFGFSLSLLMELLTNAIEIGLRNPPIIRMKYDEAIEQLAQLVNQTTNVVRAAIEQFLNRPRDDFFKPGQGYVREDVYPWAVIARTDEE